MADQAKVITVGITLTAAVEAAITDQTPLIAGACAAIRTMGTLFDATG